VSYHVRKVVAGGTADSVGVQVETLQDVWSELYVPPGEKPPHRVRVGVVHGEMVQTQFDGSYPSAIMWLLGLHQLPAQQRLDLEQALKAALCEDGGCGEEEDDADADYTGDESA